MSCFVPCPKCGTDDWYTTETRRSDKGIRRRRRCVYCDHGVTTWEVLSTDLAEFKRGEIDKAKRHAQKALQILEELGGRA